MVLVARKALKQSKVTTKKSVTCTGFLLVNPFASHSELAEGDWYGLFKHFWLFCDDDIQQWLKAKPASEFAADGFVGLFCAFWAD